MPIQLRTVLTADATSQIVQEPDGTLSHDALFPDKPWQTTPLKADPATDKIRALLYSEKATPEQRSVAIPVALSLSKNEAPRGADVAALDATIQEASKEEVSPSEA